MKRLRAIWVLVDELKILKERLAALENQVEIVLKNKIEIEEELSQSRKFRLTRPWPQRRAYLEATDGGRVQRGKD